MKNKIIEIINSIRINKGESPLPEVLPSTTLRDGLGFTSLDLAELTVKIEDEFDIDIFEDGLISTVGEIYSKLSK